MTTIPDDVLEDEADVEVTVAVDDETEPVDEAASVEETVEEVTVAVFASDVEVVAVVVEIDPELDDDELLLFIDFVHVVTCCTASFP